MCIHVRVRSFEDLPLEGARVEVQPFANPDFVGSAACLAALEAGKTAASAATTGKDGRVEVLGVPPGRWTVVGSRVGYARGAQTVLLQAGERDASATLTLLRGHGLSGRVLERDGQPVAGAWVVAGEDWTCRARSNAEGRYVLDGLPWGKTVLRAGRCGGMPVEIGGVAIPDVSAFDIVLPPATVLSGTVTAADSGEPLAGVKVEAGIWWGGQGFGSAVTDAVGRYTIDSIPPGTVNHFDARKEGWILSPPPPGPWGIKVVLKEGETTVRDLRLVRTGRVEGVISGPEGPLAGVSVYAGVRLGEGAKSHTTESDASGCFAFDLPGGATAEVHSMVPGYSDEEFQRCAEKRDFAPITVAVLAGKTATHDIHMTRGALVRARVETAAGAPIEGAQVGGSASGPDGTVEFRGGYPGVTEWAVRKEGYVDGTLRIPGEVDRDGEPLVVRLLRRPRVSGTVTSSSGEPLQEAFVRVFVVTGRQLRTPGGGAETLWSEREPVRPDGTYDLEIPWAGPGEFRVYANAPRHAEGPCASRTFEKGKESYAADVVLDPSRSVRGRVVHRGTGVPVVGARVEANQGVGAVTDAEGRFSISTNVPATNAFLYSVRAEGLVTVNAQADPAVPEALIEMDPGLEIGGTVVFSDGSAVPRSTVDAKGPATRRVLPGPDGAFRVDQLPAGEYELTVRPWPNEAEAPFEPATVSPVRAGTRDLRIVVKPPVEGGGTISGRVLGPDRTPLNQVFVVALGPPEPGATARAETKTSSDGTFMLKGLKGSAFTVVADAPGSGFDPYNQGAGLVPATREGVASGTTGLDLVLERGLSLEGVLVDAAGKPLSGIGLEAGRQTATTDGGGKFAIGGLPAGEYALTVFPVRVGGVILVQRNERFAAGTTGIRLQAEVQKGVEVAGIVVDAAGKPVNRAAVSVTTADGYCVSTFTRPDGTFRVAGLLPGPVEVSATFGASKSGEARTEAGSTEEVRVVMASPNR